MTIDGSRSEDGPILVTGASGFVGRHLLEALRTARACAGSEDPAHEVVAWSRSAAPADLTAAARWQQVDITHRDEVRTALRALRPRRVFHLAGAAQVDRSWKHPAEILDVNVIATHHLFDGLRRNGGAARVLVTGSATVYAPSRVPIAETFPLAPDSPYALSKLAQEMLSLRAVAEDGIDVVLTRSFNHTGPGQSPSYVGPSMASQIARIERGLQPAVLEVGNLDAERDLTDVRDVVRAYVSLMASGATGEIYNVASGAGRSIRALLDALIASARVPVRVVTDPARTRQVETSVLVGDASKLRALTGWTPLISFEQMLSDLLEYWRGVTELQA
jgi:GDP-4-dehydro-6-deoxy-D-mannose reductase